jgi:hypothetical protein
MTTELINHPSHYNAENRKECIVEMEEYYGAKMVAIFCLMNAYKYLYRAGMKGGNSKQQDVSKARWYYDYATHHCKATGVSELDKLLDDISKLLKEV